MSSPSASTLPRPPAYLHARPRLVRQIAVLHKQPFLAPSGAVNAPLGTGGTVRANGAYTGVRPAVLVGLRGSGGGGAGSCGGSGSGGGAGGGNAARFAGPGQPRAFFDASQRQGY